MNKSLSAREAAARQQVGLDALYRYPQSAVLHDATPAEKHGPRLLQDALSIAARQSGQEVKLISGTERFSYAEIELYSDRLASRLIAHDVRAGDRVILGIPNSGEFMIGCFAVWKARALVVALDHGMLSTNLKHILKTTEPAALISSNTFAERLQEMPEVLRSFRAFFVKDSTKTSVDAQIAVESLQTIMASKTQTEALRVMHNQMSSLR